MKENGQKEPETVKEFTHGQTVPSTQGNGSTTKQTGKANSYMQMEIYMKEIGYKTWRTGSESTLIRMVPNTKGNGRRTINMVTEQKYGLMVVSTRGCLCTGRKTERAFTNGQTDPNTMESGSIIKQKDRAPINGQMAGSMSDYGSII